MRKWGHLTKRHDFLTAGKTGVKAFSHTVVMQLLAREADVRVGFRLPIALLLVLGSKAPLSMSATSASLLFSSSLFFRVSSSP